MNEKVSFQNIAENLAQKRGVSKKVAETFTKAFFDTIVEALYMGEDSIRVKGLGTFKLIEMGERESVNVTNGERIVIPGYKKVAFTADDTVVDLLNPSINERAEVVETKKEPVAIDSEDISTLEQPQKEESISNDEEVPVEEMLTDESSLEEMPLVGDVSAQPSVESESSDEAETLLFDNLVQVPEPDRVEQPQDDFAGIDMLISTPESVKEIRQQYEEAKEKMDSAIAEARKAHAEKLRLEKLLERLEANMMPEQTEEVAVDKSEQMPELIAETPIVSEHQETPATVVQTTPSSPESAVSNEEKRKEALKRLMNNDSEHRDDDDEDDEDRGGFLHISGRMKYRFFVAMVLALFCVIIYFLYKTSTSIESVERVPWVEQKTQEKLNADRDLYIKNSADRNNVDNDKTAKDKDVKKSNKETTSVKVDTSKLKPTKTDVKESPEQKPQRPATYTMKKGESLTRISQRFYGTKDSVNAIIRINKFPDPNNVPIGAVISLP